MFAKFTKQHGVGARPGTLVQSEHAIESIATIIQYSPAKLKRQTLNAVDEIEFPLPENQVTWIDVQGLANHELITQLGEKFDFHPLMLSDIVNVPQRPKTDSYDNQILVIVRMARTDEQRKPVSEQVSLVIGKHFVISFQEQHGDVWEPVRKRMKDKLSRLRKKGADYLAYALLDTIIDGYYPVLEIVGEEIEELEDQVMSESGTDLLKSLNQMKNRLVGFRRTTWPHRDAISSLVRDDHELIDREVQLYLRDTYDHCVQSTEVIETYRETITGLMNLNLSVIANRTNDVMKVLTIVSTVFIPLTFIAGIYGMNFHHMPEIPVTWAYPAVLLTMFLIGGCMLFLFWRKGWIRLFGPRSSA